MILLAVCQTLDMNLPLFVLLLVVTRHSGTNITEDDEELSDGTTTTTITTKTAGTDYQDNHIMIEGESGIYSIVLEDDDEEEVKIPGLFLDPKVTEPQGEILSLSRSVSVVEVIWRIQVRASGLWGAGRLLLTSTRGR